jgi:hypothetical protein
MGWSDYDLRLVQLCIIFFSTKQHSISMKQQSRGFGSFNSENVEVIIRSPEWQAPAIPFHVTFQEVLVLISCTCSELAPLIRAHTG